MNKKTGKHISGATGPAMRLFMDYPWPGNVRELENAVEHAFVLCGSDRIDATDLPAEIRRAKDFAKGMLPASAAEPQRSARKKLTRELLLNLLKECDWNKAEVGRRVGLSRPAIYKRMKKWEIPLANPEED
jgi:DNA-binding NtrC family response regulator